MKNRIDNICNQIINKISSEINTDHPYIIAIDGNCASGKSTVAKALSEKLSADIVHMDDFYIPLELRTEEQMAKPGGNIDFGRLLTDIIIPLRHKKEYVYKAYNCQRKSFDDPYTVKPKQITIVEGAYSCHPMLYDNYACKVFISVSEDEQMGRILARNGEKKTMEFKTKWIPRENLFFTLFNIKNKCDMVFDSQNGVLL